MLFDYTFETVSVSVPGGVIRTFNTPTASFLQRREITVL